MSIEVEGPVCVLGFGRSGTSLTMRLLNLLGVDVGPAADLQPPLEAENPRGYWEPRWMLDINDEILALLDTDWWHPLTAEPGWQSRPEFDAIRQRARDLLSEKFGSSPLWGWKEPRTTLTLPFWQELVPNAKYVICLRNPVDAISSFQRRPEPHLPIRAWGNLWLEYTARALEGTQGQPRLLVFYEDYFRGGRRQIGRLASFLGMDPDATDSLSERLSLEIDENLRHHSTSSRELAIAWGVSPAARLMFLALRAAEAGIDGHSATGNPDEEWLSNAIERLAPELMTESQSFATHTHAAKDRLELVGRLEAVASERLELIYELDQVANARLQALETATERLKVQDAELDALRATGR